MGMTPQQFHTISTFCGISLLLTQMCFVCCVQRVVEGSVVGSAGSAFLSPWRVSYVVVAAM